MYADGTIDKIRLLTDFAQSRFDCTVGQLALAWCAKNQNVSTVLLGATKSSQLKENLHAIAVAEQMTPEDMESIEAIMKNKPAA